MNRWFRIWCFTLLVNWTFFLWCVPLISTKILGQFVTRMQKNWLILKIISQCDSKHILMSQKKKCWFWRSLHKLSQLRLDVEDCCYSLFICKLNIFPLISQSNIVNINLVTATGIYRSMLHHIMMCNVNKNKSNRFEGRDRHTRCDTSDKVCLDLQNCCYFVFLVKYGSNFILKVTFLKYPKHRYLQFCEIVLSLGVLCLFYFYYFFFLFKPLKRLYFEQMF
jgi:hypothetical protein